MILNENYAILEEDEELEMLEEEFDEEILMEGEVLLDEEMEILNEAMILSASDVDTSASSKAIASAKTKIDKAISSGKYRAYKSSDSALVEKAIKSKNMLKSAAITIAGSIVGAGVGVGLQKGGTALKTAVIQGTDKKDKERVTSKNSVLKKNADDANSAFAGKKYEKYAKKHGVNLSDSIEAQNILAEAMELYMECAIDEVLVEDYGFVLNEADMKSKVDVMKNKAKAYGNKAVQTALNNSSKVKTGASAGAGAVGGALAGKALAKKILSGMKYKVFTLSGLTILSLYSTSKEGEAKGKSVCYALATSVDGTKLMMHKISLKSK